MTAAVKYLMHEEVLFPKEELRDVGLVIGSQHRSEVTFINSVIVVPFQSIKIAFPILDTTFFGKRKSRRKKHAHITQKPSSLNEVDDNVHNNKISYPGFTL